MLISIHLSYAEGASDVVKKDFLGEAHMLAKFSHPNVLGLLKVVTRTEPILVVLPYMTNGDLKGFLRR
jgi:serine/threonine protein kinase